MTTATSSVLPNARLLYSILKKIPLFKNVPIDSLSITKLDGGTNDNFCVSYNEEKYVLRLPGVGTTQYIDRKAEQDNTQIAHNLGICPETLYFDSQTGIQLRRFSEGIVVSSLGSNISSDIISSMAIVLRTLHNSPMPFLNNVNYFDEIKHYHSLIYKRNQEIQKKYAAIDNLIMRVKSTLDQQPVINRPCHNDPNLANFVYLTNSSKALLIDWEHARNNDPAWDLACVINYGEFQDKQSIQFLNAYFADHIDETQFHRINLYKAVSNYFYALWVRLQIENGNLHDPVEELENIENFTMKAIEDYVDTDAFQMAIKVLNQKTILKAVDSRYLASKSSS